MPNKKPSTKGANTWKDNEKALFPANKVPLIWGQWPTPDVPLTILDRTGTYSFVQPFACGEWNAIQVVPWQERANPQAARLVVAAERVALPAKHAAALAPTKSAKPRTKPVIALTSSAQSRLAKLIVEKRVS